MRTNWKHAVAIILILLTWRILADFGRGMWIGLTS